MKRLSLFVALFAGSVAADTLGQTTSKPGSAAPYVVNIQGNASGTPIPVTGSLSVSGTADTAGNSATFNANNVCSTVLTAGEQSVGFHLTAGTLDATLTAYGLQSTGAVNCATAGTCTALTFSSGSTIVVTNPSGVKDVGINVVGGLRQVQVCTTTFAGGSAAGNVTATFLQAASAGGSGGSVTQGTSPWVVSGTVSANATLQAGAALVGKVGIDQTTPGTTNGVQVNAALPAGANVIGHVIADTGSTTAVTGNVTAVQATGSNLHVVADSGSTTAVTQPTGTNLHAVIDTGSTTAVTQATGTNLHAVIDSGSTTAATQATASNLNAQVQGAAASGATKAGNPVQIGGVFNTTQPTVTTGQAVEAQSTARGAQIVATGADTFNATINAALPAGSNVIGALTANQSVNLAQVAGASTAVGHGTAAAALRVELPTDGTGVVGLAAGSATIGALTANQSVNVAQINGVTTLMGNGVTGTGSQRVTIASDNTAFAIKVSDGTNTSVVTAASTAPVTGSAALTIVESPNSLGCAGQKLSSTSFKNVSMTANTQVITGTAAQNVYICHVDLVTASANNVAVVEGTGSTCATGTAGMWGGTTAATGWNLAANGGIATGDGMHAIGKTATQADNVCIFVSAAVQLSGSITWVSF